MILKRLVLGPLQTNCYILWDKATKEAAIFDPADNGTRIMDVVIEYDLSVKYIVLTHTHIDHVNALDYVKEQTGAEVVVHEDEKKCLNSDFDTMAFIVNSSAPRTKADITVLEGDTLFLGDKELKILHTPGHTVGGVCYLCDGILFAGDTLFAGSIGRTDFPGGSFETLRNSIKRIYTLPDDTVLLSGHGGKTTVINEKRYNPFVRG
jgi:glyoxylase-like metal-dependent hydrolase (beta-lactamase superfamily II)